MRTQNIFLKKENIESGYLTTLEGHTKKTFEINEYTIIGRDPSAHISMLDEYASTRHSRIDRRGDGFYIKDMRSSNGTYINGCRILEAKLQDKDRLQIGLTEFIFRHENESSESSATLHSKNTAWDNKLKKIPAIARSPHPVLITGPSGSGKEVLASSIHKYSTRSGSVFLSVNCSALAENLAESELFGHRKGSFTGANEDRKGAFEAARGGTLFLDEIGDLPMSLQPKLLRALENNEIKPVGSDKTQKIDVRILSATNKNLLKMIDSGLFREDLYYRLQILQIKAPPLIERMEDFDTLLNSLAKTQRVHFTVAAIKKMQQYSWPGNIRELKNMIARASAIFSPKPVDDCDIEELLELKNNVTDNKKLNAPFMTKEMLKNFEREAIEERLAFYAGNQRRVAEDLGIAKSTLNDKIKNYRIDIKLYKNKF